MSIISVPPLAYTIPHAFLCWAVFAWAYWPELMLITRPRPAAKAVDAGSLRVLTIGLALAFAAAEASR